MNREFENSFSKYLAEMLASRCGLNDENRDCFALLVVRLCTAMDEGHICLRVDGDEERLLLQSPIVGRDGFLPLVLRYGKLYLHRYYHYLQRLADQLAAMAQYRLEDRASDALLQRYFPGSSLTADDQAAAAELALARRFSLICGGPGTGKTTTVVKILALLLEQTGYPLRIALAAPTGKAAGRLSQSIGASLRSLQSSEWVVSAIPDQAQTLHRLLGFRRDSPQFRHHHDRPLPYDIVVVDEASMVDLAMMSKLVDAVPPDCRLILLGDKDQLASVESGAGLGDLIQSLPENCIELRKTYRFDENIKQFATAVKNRQGEIGWRLLMASPSSNVTLLNGDFHAYIADRYYGLLQSAGDGVARQAGEILERLRGFMVLCSVRFGQWGVDGINRAVELAMMRKGLDCRPGAWYPGRPVLITENDYTLGLYNGDIGICLRTGSGELAVCFSRLDGSVYDVPVTMLPAAETAYALTIHKSQGSEFDEVVVVLPPEEQPVLSRELLYTAVTRAKLAVRLVGSEHIFLAALNRPVLRDSGLGDAIAECCHRIAGE